MVGRSVLFLGLLGVVGLLVSDRYCSSLMIKIFVGRAYRAKISEMGLHHAVEFGAGVA